MSEIARTDTLDKAPKEEKPSQEGTSDLVTIGAPSKPEVIADWILRELDGINTAKARIPILRRMLKLSCEYYGQECHDPSVKPRGKKEV